MILTLKEVKEYLKIDCDDDDDLINELIIVAEDYLFSATGKKFNSSNKKAKLYCKVLICEWYKDRNLMQDNKISNKVKYTLSSIFLQLRYSDLEENDLK